MQRSGIRTGLLIALAIACPCAWAKGPVVEIEIRGDGLTAPVVITDRALTSEFTIWEGPGVTIDGKPYRPRRLPSGAFFDWRKGAVDPPAGLRRFEVSFRIETPRDGIHEYLFAYGLDDPAERGYVYLPMWENSLIWHGIEGHWLPASPAWDEFVRPLIVESATVVSAASRLRCVGTATMADDGTIALQFSRDGRDSGKYAFTPATEGYAAVAAHVGEMSAGDRKPITCWPRPS